VAENDPWEDKTESATLLLAYLSCALIAQSNSFKASLLSVRFVTLLLQPTYGAYAKQPQLQESAEALVRAAYTLSPRQLRHQPERSEVFKRMLKEEVKRLDARALYAIAPMWRLALFALTCSRL